MDGKECFFDCGRMGFEYLLKEKESVEDRDAPEYLCQHSTANVYTFAYGSWAPEFWRCKIPLNFYNVTILKVSVLRLSVSFRLFLVWSIFRGGILLRAPFRWAGLFV